MKTVLMNYFRENDRDFPVMRSYIDENQNAHHSILLGPFYDWCSINDSEFLYQLRTGFKFDCAQDLYDCDLENEDD